MTSEAPPRQRPGALAVPGHPGARSRAGFSSCRAYRYTLVREWDRSLGRVCFCMLNPSTADAQKNDPTVRRTVGFALDWGYGSIEVVNVFALRSTNPRGLYEAIEPVGRGNDAALRRAFRRADRVVAAWGNHAGLGGRSARVRGILHSCGVEALCFGETGAGEPRHPLYVARDAALVVLS